MAVRLYAVPIYYYYCLLYIIAKAEDFSVVYILNYMDVTGSYVVTAAHSGLPGLEQFPILQIFIIFCISRRKIIVAM